MSERAPAGGRPRGLRRFAPVAIDISGRSLLLTLAIAAAVWLVFHLPHVLVVVGMAWLLATAIDGPVAWLAGRRVPRPLAIFLVYTALVACVVLVGAVIVPIVRGELSALRTDLPRDLTDWEDLIDRYAPGSTDFVSTSDLTGLATGQAGAAAMRLTILTVDLAKTLALIFVTLVVAFFLAADPTLTERALARFLPATTFARVAPAVAESRRRIGEWARGQVLIALIFGAAMGLGLKLIGVHYAISLGVVAAVLEIVPYLGGAITVALAVLAATAVGLPQVIAVVILYVILVNLESHVLSPLLYGKAVGLPPVAILLALLTGVELLGIIGALIAVPVAVVVAVLFDAFFPEPRPATVAAEGVDRAAAGA
ncbi:MAG TPA: AI-2E family transporter [Thermomicrobiales bacterium]|nr:AI-2E family transporter [Thermomicrobiales bacterium]